MILDNFCKEYEKVNYGLYVLLEGINAYKDDEGRIADLRYNQLVNKADELAGRQIELEAMA